MLYATVLLSFQTLECRRNDLQYLRDIARGSFGQIFEATMTPSYSSTLHNSNSPPSTTPTVAVKVLETTSSEMEAEFLRSAEVLSELTGHPNIIRLLGVCLSLRPFCLVVEYANGGDLRRFLRDSAPDHFIERWRRSYRDSLLLSSASSTLTNKLSISQQVKSFADHFLCILQHCGAYKIAPHIVFTITLLSHTLALEVCTCRCTNTFATNLYNNNCHIGQHHAFTTTLVI